MKLYIIILICFIIYTLLNVKKKSNENFENISKLNIKIPKIIWTYWESEDLPPFVQGCINTWYKYNPDYKINILNRNNINNYLDFDVYNLKMADSQQRISDFIRLNVLATNGGFWIDASIILNQSLEWIRDLNVDVMCYSIDHIRTPDITYPVIESWFFACIPNSDYVTKWRDEFMTINNFDNPQLYIDDVKNRSADLSSQWCSTYLLIHVAAQAVLQLHKTSSTMKVLDARSTAFNHLRFSSNPTDIEEGLNNICTDSPEPVIKIRGIDRGYMKENMDKVSCLLNFLEINNV